MATLPTVSEVNASKGDALRGLYKQVFGEKTTSKDSDALRKKIVSHLKFLAKAKPGDAPANGANGEASAAYASNMKAAEAAEKAGEWLTAALAWESAAKLTVGKGKELCLERAAKARINAKAPPLKSDKAEARGAKAAEAKAAREAKTAEAKAKKDAKAAEKALKKEAKAAERAAKKEAKKKPFEHDPRIAHLVGKTIVHETRGGDKYEIKVLPGGFEYKGAEYKSLSAIGKHITGKSTNGFVFFGLVAAPRPDMKDEEAIVAGYAEARKGNSDLPQSLEKVLASSTEDAHASLGAIEAAIEEYAKRTKALRLACRLVEAKKGRAQ